MTCFSEAATKLKNYALVFSVGVLLACYGFAGAGEGAARAVDDGKVLSGGVGEGARKQLAEQARDYNLKLVFALSTDHFIADVPFQVQSGGTVVVDHVSRGPWAFVKLAPGNYTVKATYEGLTQTRKVNVPKTGQRRLPFSWPAPARVKEQPK